MNRRTPITRISRLAPMVIVIGVAMLSAGCGKPPVESTPAERVNAMARYSSEGMAPEYIDCFTGQLRAALEQTRDQMKPGAFGELLRNRSASVRGVAISDQTQPDENTSKMKVEWIFEDRNEAQYFTLLKVDGDWKISEMSGAQYNKPEIPYGTKVFE
jgi:hypothetical protein